MLIIVFSSICFKEMLSRSFRSITFPPQIIYCKQLRIHITPSYSPHNYVESDGE